MAQYASAIQKNESGGDYGIVGPTHPKYGRALGAYQVMEANLPGWSKEAVGRVVSPDEFLASKEIQDAVFKQQFGKSVDKYGNPQDAASVWFTGKPLAEGANRRDVLGTTGQSYVDKFSRALGQGDRVRVASADPGFVPQPRGMMAYTSPDTPPASAMPPQMPPQAAPQAPQGPAMPQGAPQAAPDPTADNGSPTRPAELQRLAQAAASPQVIQSAQQTAQTPQGQALVKTAQGASLATIMDALANPWLSEGQRSVLMVLAKEKIDQADPMRQLQMRKVAEDLANAPLERRMKEAQVKAAESGLEAKPEYKVIGKDEFGNERYGWVDPRKQTVTPAAVPGTAPSVGPSAIPPAPPGVDPKVWREQYSKNAASDSLPPDQDKVSSMRKEVQDLPSYKNMAQAAPVYKSMSNAAGRDNRAADVNMIYGLAKIMDPGSVVRESEMSVAQAIATLPQQLQAQISSQLASTGRLTPELRAQIMEEAHSRVSAYNYMFQRDAEMFKGIAGRRRMDPRDVIPDFGEFEMWKPPVKGEPAPAFGGGAPAPVQGPPMPPAAPSQSEIEAEMRRRGLK
jgi:hypothetical protein